MGYEQNRGAGSPRLVGFVTSADNSLIDTAAVRSHCERLLPAYMVPTTITELATMPRTPAGKFDRVALSTLFAPVEEIAGQPHLLAGTAPETATECTLTEIWEEVLGIEQVGVDENFFELGGDSLLSIRILSRASKAGLRIEPEEFLNTPTIHDQAKLADAVVQPSESAKDGVQERYSLSGLNKQELAEVAEQIRSLDQRET